MRRSSGPSGDEEIGHRAASQSELDAPAEAKLQVPGRNSVTGLRSPTTRSVSSQYRQKAMKRPQLKLKKKENLEAELAKYRKKFATFDSAYSNTLTYYFLIQYLRERRLQACFDFVNKVDVYRSLQKPTQQAAESALAALRHVAFVQSTNEMNANECKSPLNKAPTNALPVEGVVDKIQGKEIDEKMFDACYVRVREVLESFYKPFLLSDHFVRFVQIMEYSNRKVNLKDLQSVAHLGQGAFGRVIAVEKKDTHALFAMKEIPKAVLRKHKTGWMCLNEMQLLSRTKSPFVLSLKYSFHSQKAVHLVFEMCTGGDLREYLEKAPFDLERTRFYTAEILLGIDHIHQLEYAYRDLKPSNILLTQDGHCKISDLGLVVKLPKPPKILKHVAGTPGYWPPEIVSRTGTYRSSDYWSLGVLVYAMLSGKKIPDPNAKERMARRRKQSSEKKLQKLAKKDDPIKWSPFSANPKEQLVAKKDPKYKNINVEIKWQEIIGEEARKFIADLLVVDPKQRLGGTKGLEEFKMHPFLSVLDWHAIENLEATPPFIPAKKDLKKSKQAAGNLDFKAVKDDKKEKQFYDGFLFVNEEGFFEEVVDALEDDRMGNNRPPGGCCSIS